MPSEPIFEPEFKENCWEAQAWPEARNGVQAHSGSTGTPGPVQAHSGSVGTSGPGPEPPSESPPPDSSLNSVPVVSWPRPGPGVGVTVSESSEWMELDPAVIAALDEALDQALTEYHSLGGGLRLDPGPLPDLQAGTGSGSAATRPLGPPSMPNRLNPKQSVYLLY